MPSSRRAPRAFLPALLPWLAAALCSCVGDNPDYFTGDGGIDLAIGGRDLAPPPGCAAGSRTCLSPTSAAGCAGGAWVADRACPGGSTCMNGACQPPPREKDSLRGLPCESEIGCYNSPLTYNYSCEPFLVGEKVEWRCGDRLGDGASGQSCTTGAECRTGFCLEGRNTCLRRCNGTDADCPYRGNTHLVCRSVPLRVDGVTVMANSCVYP